MSAYGSANDLAFFFLKDPPDLWLANHFFDKCLEFGKKIEDDGKMRESEAHCNVGIMWFFEGTMLKSEMGAARISEKLAKLFSEHRTRDRKW